MLSLLDLSFNPGLKQIEYFYQIIHLNEAQLFFLKFKKRFNPFNIKFVTQRVSVNHEDGGRISEELQRGSSP